MFVKMLVSSLIRRRSRMMVALLAIAIGATVLLGMAAISFDIPRQMGREFRSYGANMILVPPGGEANVKLEDIERVSGVIPEDSLVGMTPYRYEIVRINMQGYTAAGTIFEEARLTSPYWSVSGNWPQGADDILIGLDIAEFTRLTPGSSITITGRGSSGARFRRDMTVSGIVRTGSVEDGFIFMSLPTLEELMGDSGTAAVVEVSVAADESELNALVSSIGREVPGVSPRLVKRVTQSETTVLSKLQSLVFLVSLVVLVLTMICVATTMMTVVMERRKEIGLKKAIGANNRIIAIEFLGEGLLLGGAGGLLGGIFGFVFAEAVSINVFGRGVFIDWKLLPITMAVSMAVTVAACLGPVRRATDVEPALVLRGE
ncbi:MAG: ABC transporter permease [Synergistaceae bacterium]|jgi:putative ABC transport system permease protein|nr:ABC transporter permease [Synergistaceae bacterium]